MKQSHLYTYLLLGVILIFLLYFCGFHEKAFELEQKGMLKFEEAFWNYFHNSDLVSQEIYLIDLDFDNIPEILLYESRGSGGIIMGDIYAYKNGSVNKIDMHSSELKLFKNATNGETIWISISIYKVGSEYVNINYDIWGFSNILQPRSKELYGIIQYFDYGEIDTRDDTIIDKQKMEEISKDEFEKIKLNFLKNYSEVRYKQENERTHNLNRIDSDALKDLDYNLFRNFLKRWYQ